MEMIIIYLVLGGVTAAIASSKGRNPVAWFFLGALFSCIAIILVLCLPNLKEQKAKEERLEEENRRIREQLRQEQMRLEAFREQTNLRLQHHDQALQMDTTPRYDSPLGLGGAAEAPPSLPGGGQDDHRPVWFYVKGDDRCGPVTLGSLRALIAGGQVSADSLFWRVGMPEWQSGRAIPEIRSIIS
jgi:hypothetical protein